MATGLLVRDIQRVATDSLRLYILQQSQIGRLDTTNFVHDFTTLH